MFTLSTTLGGRALALTSSLLFHAGVVAALGGHGPEARAARPREPVVVDFALANDAPVVVPLERAPAAPVRVQHGAPHAHTHSYPVAPQHDARPHDPAMVHTPLPAHPEAAFALALPVAPAAAAPRFAIQLGAGTSRAAVSELGSAAGVASGGAAEGEPVAEAGVDAPATLLSGAPPPYPQAARAASIEADVALEIIVDGRGHVTSARVLRRIGYGLDEAAVAGMRAYHFRPARLGGRVTPVRMKWTMLFRLQ